MKVICKGCLFCDGKGICEHSRIHDIITGSEYSMDNCFLNHVNSADDKCTCISVIEQRKKKLEKINESK